MQPIFCLPLTVVTIIANSLEKLSSKVAISTFWLSIAVVLSSGSLCSAKDIMYWQKVNWPPFQILKGEDAGRGRFDSINQLLQNHLVQYDHENIQMNWVRYWQELREGKHILNSMAIKTEERLQYAVFSEPVSFSLPHRIIVTKSKADQMGNPQSLSLFELFTDPGLKGIIMQGRSYAPTLDSLLEKQQAVGNYQRKSLDAEQILKMIISGRADYTIEYPLVVDYILSKVDVLPGETALTSIAVKELPPYVVAHVAAPKNSWGKKVIGEINVVLEELKKEKMYQDIHLLYSTGDQEKKKLLEFYEKVLLQ